MYTISTPHLAKALEGSAFTLIDVLPEDVHAKAHIPGAINIPLESGNFAERVTAAVDSKGAPVVVYCSDVTCDLSKRAAQQLHMAGLRAVYRYEGGLQAWAEAGQPVESALAAERS